MSTVKTSSEVVGPTISEHVAAMPYPGRGHINPMMNLCKLLASKQPQLLITFVVTEEWLGFIGSDKKPDNIRLASIPNVIPSELVKAADFPGFFKAVTTKTEAPFDRLIDRLQPPVTSVIADAELLWGVGLGMRRNIPVALFWTMSANFLTMLHRFNRLDQVEELDEVFETNDPKGMELSLKCIAMVPKAQCLISTSVYELEPQIFNFLQAEFSFPIYPIGPAIPYLELESNCNVNSVSIGDNGSDHVKWLDSQPKASVLYISLGSFLSVSSTQMDEMAAGLRNTGVRFFWVARGESSRLRESCGDMGLVVSWCDQLKVLCHSSVGGFWSHCGWNSTLEAVFAGVPMLTMPLFLDQVPNSIQIVEDWKIGWRVREVQGDQKLITREEITGIVLKCMDLESGDGKEMRKRAEELSDICHQAIAKGGSSDKNLDGLISNVIKAAAIKGTTVAIQLGKFS